MPIILPDLTTSGLLRLGVCGRIVEPDKSLAKWLEERRSLICTYTLSHKKYFARVITGGVKGHFHVESASSTFFPRQPNTNAQRKDWDVTTDKVIGAQVIARIRSWFEVPLTSLAQNGVIRTLSQPTSAAGASLKLTAGTLTLSGSPIDRVEWELRDKQRIRVAIDSVRTVTIDENYLVEMQKWSRALFDATVLSTEVTANVGQI